MASTSLALLSPKPTLFIRRDRSSSNAYSSLTTSYNFHQRRLQLCKAAASSSLLITEFDLYDLLGIESSSDQIAIKTAYRSLQKRCHPDIAGPAGHDMAIILNEAYALLSDPVSRSAYDKEQAKTAELRGYTGSPLYSVWLGPETEERAVFVDEVKCVGCLKCALFANKTFAIESVYGRARVVAQWADPEHKIQESIDACPVNCISIVEREELAALEFLMSKQPRGIVRIGASNTGKRVFDVFSKYSTLQTDARMSAIQAIRSISNWLYWTSPGSETSSNVTLLKGAKTCTDPDINKLRDAASARRHSMFKTRENMRFLPQTTSKDEYWIPSTPVFPPETKHDMSNARATTPQKPYSGEKTYVKRDIKHTSPFVSSIPMGLAVIAASIVRLHEAGDIGGGLEEHIGGSFVLLVNSSWLQVVLAGATWYLIGIFLIPLVEALASRGDE